MKRRIRIIEQAVSRIFLSGFFVVSLSSACLKQALEPEEDGAPSSTVWKLNKNVKGLRGLANACMDADSVAFFNLTYNEDKSVLYGLCMQGEGGVELYSEIVSEEIIVPELSMIWDENAFYWTVNGTYLTDLDGNRISVTDLTKPVSFLLHDELICCRVKDSIVDEYPSTRADYLEKDVAVDFDTDNNVFNVRLSSGYRTSLPAVSDFHLTDTTVANRSYYKDIFLDAGIALTSRKSLAAAKYLGLSLEGISFPYAKAMANDKTKQTAIISGDAEDLNGRLLYPDGQPRYRLLFVNGGNSTYHGQSLEGNSLDNMRSFVKNGGSYVGTCAGAFFASNGVDGKVDFPYYLSVWPGMMKHTGLNNSSTGMFIEKDSPLLRYYDFGGDHYVDSVRHNAGGYPVRFPLRTEILARFDYPKMSSIHRKPCIWAYKETPRSGRIVMEASHPEEVPDGERRDLTAAMISYALDGVGMTFLKGFLNNGEERVMDKSTPDNNPAYTRIGDLQTHHFAVYLPPDARSIRVELDSSSDCDFALMMNQGTYAFSDDAEYRSSVPGARQQLSFPALREGLWFIAVQCLTTVTVTETDYGQAYSGKTEVLNGVPYKIMISWE